jgi:DNA-binding MarR family transcriptional regulator
MENKDPENKEIVGKEISVDDKVVQIILDDSADLSVDDFHTNDKKVLSLLSQDTYLSDSHYTFNGLVRKLGIHQQSLARSLHRLEEVGLVKKTNAGYKLSKNLDSVLVKSRIDLENLSKRISHQYASFEQILQLYIPTTINVEEIVTKLVGKWFGNLRWIGFIDGDNGCVLQWASNDKYYVNLKIVSRYAIIETNASGQKNKSESIISAYKILEQITKLLKPNEKTPKNNLISFNQYN